MMGLQGNAAVEAETTIEVLDPSLVIEEHVRAWTPKDPNHPVIIPRDPNQ